MTLRDYFAAKALPSAIEYWRSAGDWTTSDPDFIFGTEEEGGHMKFVAETAYDMADAMLKARQQ
jgi:hypothetical protein